eukprot:4731226-Pleurochrysis_carterae.AAC.1
MKSNSKGTSAFLAPNPLQADAKDGKSAATHSVIFLTTQRAPDAAPPKDNAHYAEEQLRIGSNGTGAQPPHTFSHDKSLLEEALAARLPAGLVQE